MDWLLRQRDVRGVGVAWKQRDGDRRQQRREEGVEVGRRRRVVGRGVVAVFLAGFLAGRVVVVVRREGRGLGQRVAGDEEARDARDVLLLCGAGGFAEEPFHQEGEGQSVGFVAGDGEAADEGDFGALVGTSV